jgi:hypothetical protein
MPTFGRSVRINTLFCLKPWNSWLLLLYCRKLLATLQYSVLNSGHLVATIPWMFAVTLADPSLPASKGQRDVPR